MKPVLYPSTERNFTTQGIGTLDCISCVVTEGRNGIFEAEFRISTDALHYQDCVEGNIVYCPHDDTKRKQPFQIYKRSKPINGVVTVHAEHVTYRLSKMVTTPFTSTAVAHALQALKDNAVEACPFEFWTDKGSIGTFSVEQPCSIRSKLGGESGSILDAFGGGEYEWDHFTVKLYQHRGVDNGVVLRRGKNITDYTKLTDTTGVYTGIVPYYMDNGEVMMLPEKVLRLSGAPAGYTIAVDLSDKFESKPTVAQLRAAGNTYLRLNAKPGATVNTKVSFVALWQTEEYKNVAPLQRVRLCDTVSIVYDNDDALQTKVIKTVYNVLLERYDEIELGEATTNMNSAIKGITETLTGEDMTKTEVQKALEHAAQLITGGLGGYVVFNRNADGEPQEILIMDTDNKETAMNVIRMNKNGIAFSQRGYNGPFNTAWTIDSRFVADFITAGTLNATLIKAGILSAQNASRNFWNMLTGEFHLRSDNATTGIDYQNGVLNINASAIRSGTLDASVANITNINASNIKSGSMSANYISGGTIDASKVNVTNINATNIKTGTLSANLVRSGVLQSNNSRVYFDLNNSRLVCTSSDGRIVSTFSDGTLHARASDYRDIQIQVYSSILNQLTLNGPLYANSTALFQSTVHAEGNITTSAGVQAYGNINAGMDMSAQNLHLAQKGYAQEFVNQSDRDRKKNIVDLAVEKAKDFIMRLVPKKYKYKSGGNIHHGFIAQDIKEIIDEPWDVYTEYEDADGKTCGIGYTEIIADLVAVVQDQERRITELEGKI